MSTVNYNGKIFDHWSHFSKNSQEIANFEILFDVEIITANIKPYEKLAEIIHNYGDLSDLICNRAIRDHLFDAVDTVEYCKSLQNITYESLQGPEILSSHIAEVYSTDQLISYSQYGNYPDNIFTSLEQEQLLIKSNIFNPRIINNAILENKLNEIEYGTVLKIVVFKILNNSFSGHSVLIKKYDNDQYLFFDPSAKLLGGLQVKEIIDLINEVFTNHDASELYISSVIRT